MGYTGILCTTSSTAVLKIYKYSKIKSFNKKRKERPLYASVAFLGTGRGRYPQDLLRGTVDKISM